MSRISSLLNSPPLSVMTAFITPNVPIQFSTTLSIMQPDNFLSTKTDKVNLVNISIMCKIHLEFHFFKSIATFSLKCLAAGNATTGRGLFLRNSLQRSQFSITDISEENSCFHTPASLINAVSLSMAACPNCLCNFTKIFLRSTLGNSHIFIAYTSHIFSTVSTMYTS